MNTISGKSFQTQLKIAFFHMHLLGKFRDVQKKNIQKQTKSSAWLFDDCLEYRLAEFQGSSEAVNPCL